MILYHLCINLGTYLRIQELLGQVTSLNVYFSYLFSLNSQRQLTLKGDFY